MKYLIATLLALCLAAFPLVSLAAAADRWPDEYSTGPFVYHADFPLSSLRPMLDGVHDLQQDVPATLGINRVQEPIHVFLFGQRDTYQNYVRHYFPTVPQRRALFIKERGPGMVFAHNSKLLPIDLRHETTHAVLHSVLPMVPLWLDEGLAEYFEVASDRRAFENPHFKPVRRNAIWGRAPDLTKLEQITELSRMQAGHYRDAWAWVHFMLHGPSEARSVLQQYLLDIQAHVPPGTFSDRLRRDIPDCRQRFVRHFQSWKRYPCSARFLELYFRTTCIRPIRIYGLCRRGRLCRFRQTCGRPDRWVRIRSSRVCVLGGTDDIPRTPIALPRCVDNRSFLGAVRCSLGPDYERQV